MRKIWLWIKVFIALLVGITFFIVLYKNSGLVIAEMADDQLIVAPFDYLISEKEIPISTLLFFTFIGGALFTLIISLLLSFPTFMNALKLRSKVKQLERKIEEIELKSTI